MVEKRTSVVIGFLELATGILMQLSNRQIRFWRTLLFLAIPKTAQNFTHQIPERGAGESIKRQRTNNIDGCKAEPCGEKSIKHAFAKPSRYFGRHTVPKHLLK